MPTDRVPDVGSMGLFADDGDVMMEFSGGRLDGMKVLISEWPQDLAWPGTEVMDKPSGQIYRYHATASVRYPIYTHRPDDSANAESSNGEKEARP